MEIGKEEEAVTVEPLEDPFKQDEAPSEVPDTVPAEWELIPAYGR